MKFSHFFWNANFFSYQEVYIPTEAIGPRTMDKNANSVWDPATVGTNVILIVIDARFVNFIWNRQKTDIALCLGVFDAVLGD